MALSGLLETALAAGQVDLADLALVVARLETPHLDPTPTRTALVAIGEEAASAVRALGTTSTRARIAAINGIVYGRHGFRGNRAAYDDVRNSLLPDVVTRRLGIPITLAIVYITVARHAGVEIFGVSFPGHFLLRVPADAGIGADAPLILDPFDDGRELSQADLEARVGDHVDGVWRDGFVEPATSRQIVVRMLHNLKRLYVAQRSFEHAWRATNLIVSLDADDVEQLRDRGLLAYHLDRFTEALADLEAYVRITNEANEDAEQRSQLWEHITSLRKRVASMN